RETHIIPHRSSLDDSELYDSKTLLAEESLEIARNVAIGDEQQALRQVITGDRQRELVLGAVVGGEALLTVRRRFAELREHAADDVASRELGDIDFDDAHAVVRLQCFF